MEANDNVVQMSAYGRDSIAKLKAIAIDAAQGCKPIVAAIEAEPALTQDRYDQYLSAITTGVDAMKLPVSNKAYMFVGAILIHAGGNRRGIESALKILGAL